MQRNLMICIAEKSKKRANAKRSYAEWWLVLLDHIGYGLPDREDRDQLRTLVPRAGEWDKIILLNPLDLACSFVLQDKATVLANRLTEARLNSAPRSAR
jgi:hypothetical protein